MDTEAASRQPTPAASAVAAERVAAAADQERACPLADEAPGLLWTCDAGGSLESVNAGLCQFLGRSAGELQGQGWVEAVHPADCAAVQEVLLAAVAGQAGAVEARLRRGDGEYRWISLTLAPRESRAGAAAAGFDVTDRRRREEQSRQAEAELRAMEEEHARLLASAEQARAQAEAANRTKDEFLATLSHELRTPLNAIVGWVHLLRGGRLDDRTARRALDTIDRNAKVQTQLIADILDVSRIVSGKLHVQMREMELEPIVEAAVDTVRLAAEAKGIRIEVALDPRAGPVLGDADRLQQVVWNLLSNAIKFTGDGGRVNVALIRSGPEAVLTVSDNGAGIAPEFLPYVFDRFRQADASSTRPQGGLGLGLAIARHLAEAHGGRISVESAGSGHGAQFALRLPIVEPSASAAVGTAVAAVPLGGPSLDGVTILVVCAHMGRGEDATQLLRDRGAEVVHVADTGAALDSVRRLRPHVLLACHEGNDSDDHSLIRAVREMSPERGGLTPAALLGGAATTEERMLSLLAGYQAHVPDQADPAELASVVASLAGRTRELLG